MGERHLCGSHGSTVMPRDVLGHRFVADPARRFAHSVRPGRTLRRGDFGELEPGMIREQPDERLSDGAGRAEDGDGDATSPNGDCAQS